jgi:carbonic anhydrase
MELHLVHKDAGGKLAVVGVMIMQGAQNLAYEPILAHMPAEEGQPQVISDTLINASDLLPTDRSYYRYDGSLTTPPVHRRREMVRHGSAGNAVQGADFCISSPL